MEQSRLFSFDSDSDLDHSQKKMEFKLDHLMIFLGRSKKYLCNPANKEK